MYTFFDMGTLPKTGETWQHYKTEGEYEIVGIGHIQVKIESLDMKECVIYKALSDGKIWCRPLEDFMESLILDTGESVPRFQKVR
jgi:hypothetical protein